MSDLISRLRGDGYLLLNIHERQTLDYEAADELDRLNADVATLRSEVKGLHETSNTLHKDRDRLNAQALELCAELSGLRRENERLIAAQSREGRHALRIEIEQLEARLVDAEAMRHDLAVLRGFHHEGCMAEIERLRGLLRVAACPADCTDGGIPRNYGGEWELEQCQFCYERNAALAGAAEQEDVTP